MVYDYHYSDDLPPAQMLCRVYVNDVLVQEQRGQGDTICGLSLKSVYDDY